MTLPGQPFISHSSTTQPQVFFWEIWIHKDKIGRLCFFPTCIFLIELLFTIFPLMLDAHASLHHSQFTPGEWCSKLISFLVEPYYNGSQGTNNFLSVLCELLLLPMYETNKNSFNAIKIFFHHWQNSFSNGSGSARCNWRFHEFCIKNIPNQRGAGANVKEAWSLH